jgi:cation diffusion facilitator CzcD-associated flavoprotein CzcO
VTLAGDYDVVVVGAGFGGLYAVHRFSQQGLRVVAIEGADGPGGVWYHNRYPGARVDVDSIDYSYHFSDELMKKWNWTERYAAQPELLQYVDFVVGMFGLADKLIVGTWVTGARWDGTDARYHLTTTNGSCTARYLVMATGNLTVGKRPDIKGLDSFRGRWMLSNDWPLDEVSVEGRRVAVIGTGSTGTQIVEAVGGRAGHLYVFQRSAHYTFPARNHPLTPDDQRETQSASELREVFCDLPGGTRMPVPTRPFSDYTPEEATAVLEKQWDTGGQAIMFQFTDQSRNTEAAEFVSGFVRDKIRGRFADQDLAESLIPGYPMGVKRIALESHFYETLQRDDVTLVNLKKEPLVEVTETGIRTEAGLYEVDLIIFAIGFVAFNGALDSAGVVNEAGERPTDKWSRGPRTLLGLMTPGFPNMFVPTGPGSPSVIANLIVQNEFALDWIGDLIAYADRNGYRSVEPTEEAVAAWVDEGYQVSEKSIRRLHDNYMVKVNDDGTRILIPYAGGFRAYVAECRRIAEGGYQELLFRPTD